MFGSFDRGTKDKPMSEINMVPLIDVMLVLLVIFIVTAPFFTHAIRLNLPQSDAAEHQTVQDKLDVAINGAGELFLNGEPATREEANTLFEAEARKNPQPIVHVRADQEVAYRVVADTLSDCARAGLTQVGLVMAPKP